VLRSNDAMTDLKTLFTIFGESGQTDITIQGLVSSPDKPTALWVPLKAILIRA